MNKAVSLTIFAVVIVVHWLVQGHALAVAPSNLTSRATSGATLNAGARFVSLAPNLTEIVFALGVQNRLVGTTLQCDFPTVAKGLAKVGDYTTPNAELILKTGASMILATEGNSRPTLQKLVAAGLEVVETNPRTASELPGVIASLGEKLGAQSKAHTLAKQVQSALDSLHARGVGKGVRFLLALQFEPIYSVSNETWLGDLFLTAGFTNIVGSSKIKYPVVSQEYLLKNKPDVVFVTDVTLEVAKAKVAALWPASGAPTVVLLPSDVLVRPGPRIVEGIRFLNQLQIEKSMTDLHKSKQKSLPKPLPKSQAK